jgi:hypothetical protein
MQKEFPSDYIDHSSKNPPVLYLTGSYKSLLDVIKKIHKHAATTSYCFKFLVDTEWPISKNCAASVCLFKFLAKLKGSTSNEIKQIAKDLKRTHYLSPDTRDKGLLEAEKDKDLKTVIRFLESSDSGKQLKAEECKEKNEVLKKIKYRFDLKNNYNYSYLQGDIAGNHFITVIKSSIVNFIRDEYDNFSTNDEVKSFIYKNNDGVFCSFNSCLLCYDHEEEFNFYAICIVENVFAKPENRYYHIFFNQSIRNQFSEKDISIFRESGMKTISYLNQENDYKKKITEITNLKAIERFIHFDRFVTKPFNSIEKKKVKKHQQPKKNEVGKNMLVLYFAGFLALSGTVGAVMAIIGLDKMNWNVNIGFNGKHLNHVYQSIFTIGFFTSGFVLCVISILAGRAIKQKKRLVGHTLEAIGVIGLSSISGSILGSIVKLPAWLSYNRQLFNSAESGALYGAIAATFIVVIMFVVTLCKQNCGRGLNPHNTLIK